MEDATTPTPATMFMIALRCVALRCVMLRDYSNSNAPPFLIATAYCFLLSVNCRLSIADAITVAVAVPFVTGWIDWLCCIAIAILSILSIQLSGEKD